MKWIHKDGLSFLQFTHLSKVSGIFHGIFTRWADETQGRPSSLNLGLNGTDPAEIVWRNRRRVRHIFGPGRMVFARQVHGHRSAVWDQVSACEPQPIDTVLPDDASYLCGDALMTNQVGPGLFIQVADCQPVLIVDPVKRVVANIHSGWRGSVANIIGRTITNMQEKYGCRASDLVCGIGPSLGPCCAEFVHYRSEIPSTYWPYKLAGDRFDFWRISIDQLLSAGVARERIETSGICTRCNGHLFFSYRGQRTTGRFAAVIGLGGQ